MSTTYSTIYCAARLFHQQSSEQYGGSSLFNAFLTEDNELESSEASHSSSRKGTQASSSKTHFMKEVGNRAHVTLHNGASLWCHKESILEFIKSSKGDNTSSEALKSLESSLQLKLSLVGARALGILKVTITGPFQYAFDCKCKNILEMVPYCITLRAALQEYADDVSELLNRPKSVFSDIPAGCAYCFLLSFF